MGKFILKMGLYCNVCMQLPGLELHHNSPLKSPIPSTHTTQSDEELRPYGLINKGNMTQSSIAQVHMT